MMNSWLLLLVAYLLTRGKGGGGVAPVSSPVSTSSPSTRTVQAVSTSVPVAPQWPQVVPRDLAPFPGPGWVSYVPVPQSVAYRAAELLSDLWAAGKGAHKSEFLDGQWVTFVAANINAKKGVIAYRLTAQSEPQVAPSQAPSQPRAATPVALPASSSTALPVLRLGARGDDVKLIQKRLGVAPQTGYFGPMTQGKLREAQAKAGLPVTGEVGPQEWAMLFGRTA